MSQPPAFDPLSAAYDEQFTDTSIGRYLRSIIQRRLIDHYHSGDHVLELGCGTGEDALFLAQNGIAVTATDASGKMLAIARQKTAAFPHVHAAALDLIHLPSFGLDGPFDGVFSNFGPLNCLDDWKALAAWLSGRIKQEGVVGLGIMAPYCLWEIGWHTLHLNFRTAFRRLSKNSRFQSTPDSAPITIRYPSVKRLIDDFAPDFQQTYLRPLGLFLPPSDVYGAVERRPKLLKGLIQLEERFGAQRRLSLFADHYWIEFTRR